jgi:hypothetical protein
MKWVTRERPRIDRVACAWLIRKFIDPSPEFLFVPNDQVLPVAEREGATVFHVRAGAIGRTPTDTGFEALMRHFKVGEDDPALQRMARIIHGADVFGSDAPPESAGLRAIMMGWVDVFTDDHAIIEAGAPAYESLYQWCRRQR